MGQNMHVIRASTTTRMSSNADKANFFTIRLIFVLPATAARGLVAELL
jgi:hypothetical protein